MSDRQQVEYSSWHRLYREGWGKNRLRPESFAHPAKNSYGLSVRIYEHALEEGWIKPGQTVLDPFAGIGGFALEAMRHGLHFVGVELELRFCDMGQGCDCTGIGKEDWARFQGRWDKARYQNGRHWCPECLMKAGMVAGEREFKPLPLPGTEWATIVKTRQVSVFDAAPSASYARNSGKIPCTGAHRYHGNIETWKAQGMAGTAVIVQGDSRRLGEVLERASLCLSSPPYANSIQGNSGADAIRKRIAEGRYKGLRPDVWTSPRNIAGSTYGDGYSAGPANLGNLPDTGFEAALALGSPPYTGVEGFHDKQFADKWGPKQVRTVTPAGYGDEPGQLAQMLEGDLVLAISSPPFLAQSGGTNVTAKGGPLADASLLKRHSAGNQAAAGYGSEEGQLAQMPPGDHTEALGAGAETGKAQACISSPPFKTWSGKQSEESQWRDMRKLRVGSDREAYGGTEGQLAQMNDKDFVAVISSPPYIDQPITSARCFKNRFNEMPLAKDAVKAENIGYSSSEDNLCNAKRDTFWAASRQILEEVYKVLAPGGHAIWVVKMFVRNKQLVDFPGQWEALCQSVGFKTVCKHRAWLNKNADIMQTTLDGDEVSMEKWYKSFFRILCEKKGAPRIDWELVLCMEKSQ